MEKCLVDAFIPYLSKFAVAEMVSHERFTAQMQQVYIENNPYDSFEDIYLKMRKEGKGRLRKHLVYTYSTIFKVRKHVEQMKG